MAKKKTKAKPKSEKSTSAQPTFEQALSDLEKIVAELDAGDLGLDDSLERYERGVVRLRQCQQQLQQAERRIELLSGVDADGNPLSESFDDAVGGSLEEKSASRSKRRSAKTSSGGGSTGVDDARGLF